MIADQLGRALGLLPPEHVADVLEQLEPGAGDQRGDQRGRWRRRARGRRCRARPGSGSSIAPSRAAGVVADAAPASAGRRSREGRAGSRPSASKPAKPALVGRKPGERLISHIARKTRVAVAGGHRVAEQPRGPRGPSARRRRRRSRWQPRVSERSRSGWASASSWAIMPPIEIPKHVGALELQRVEQRRRVDGHLGGRERLAGRASSGRSRGCRRRCTRSSAPAGRGTAAPGQVGGAHALDQQQRLALPGALVVKLGPCAARRSARRDATRWRSRSA